MSSNSKKYESPNKKRFRNKSYSRFSPSSSNTSIRNGSSNEVTTSPRAKTPYFSDNPLEWDESQKNFEAELLQESPDVFNYICGRYNVAHRFTVIREVGIAGQPGHEAAIEITQAHFDSMTGIDQVKFLRESGKLMNYDKEIKGKAWSKLWSWTSQSQVLRDLIHTFEASTNSIQAYIVIKNHFELTTMHEKAALLEIQLNGSLSIVKHIKPASSKSVTRLQAHIAQISNKLSHLVPPQDVSDARKVTLFRGGLPPKFKHIADTHKATSPNDTFAQHSTKVLNDILSDELHKSLEHQSNGTSDPATLLGGSMQNTMISPKYYQSGRGYRGRGYGGRWFQDRGQGRGGGRSGGRSPYTPGKQGGGSSASDDKSSPFRYACRFCNKKGHKAADCFQKQRDESAKSATSRGRSPDNFPSNLSDDEDDTHPSDQASSNVTTNKKARISLLKSYSLTSIIFKWLLTTILFIGKTFAPSTCQPASKYNKKRASKLNWIIDSGASVHVCNNVGLLTDTKLTSTTFQLANGAHYTSSVMGNLGNLAQCIYIPDAETNILSVKLLNESGYSVTFQHDGAVTVTRDSITTTLGYQYIDDFLLAVDEFEGLHFE